MAALEPFSYRPLGCPAFTTTFAANAALVRCLIPFAPHSMSTSTLCFRGNYGVASLISCPLPFRALSLTLSFAPRYYLLVGVMSPPLCPWSAFLRKVVDSNHRSPVGLAHICAAFILGGLSPSLSANLPPSRQNGRSSSFSSLPPPICSVNDVCCAACGCAAAVCVVG